MTGQQVTIVVLNWRQTEKTLRCLRSIEQLDSPAHVIVVDNGSGDGSASALGLYAKAQSAQFPEVALIALPENVGFAVGCNFAIERALARDDCEYVFLVNNDAVLNPQTLSKLLEAANQYPQGGIFGPKVYCWHDRRKVWYAGARRRRGVLAATDTGRECICPGIPRTVEHLRFRFQGRRNGT